MTRQEARGLAEKCLELLVADRDEAALEAFDPLLSTKTPFPTLDLVGKILGEWGREEPQKLLAFFDRLVETKAMGAFVIAGQGLIAINDVDLELSFAKAREYIIRGDVWYVVDIIGERPLGHGLLLHFDGAVGLLEGFTRDANPWVRRSVGVAVHFFAKRVRDDPARIERLLALLAPLIEERDTSALKGIGWGLKTIGRYYPDLLVSFLHRELATKRPRKLLLRKATTYLDEAKKEEVRRINCSGGRPCPRSRAATAGRRYGTEIP